MSVTRHPHVCPPPRSYFATLLCTNLCNPPCACVPLCRSQVADFGMSVKLSAAQSHVSNVWQGTQFYAAPEQIEHVSARQGEGPRAQATTALRVLRRLPCALCHSSTSRAYQPQRNPAVRHTTRKLPYLAHNLLAHYHNSSPAKSHNLTTTIIKTYHRAS